MRFLRPRLVISRCIEFDACRYNGAKINSELVLRMMPYVEFLPVCMEADIGLGVPRDPVRIVRVGEEDHLFQPATGRDHTDMAVKFSRDHLSHLKDIDGFLLKSRSPSCGVRDVRVYPQGEGKASLTGRSVGMFAREAVRAFPNVPMEDEARLLNPRIADHFLTSVFALSRFRAARELGGAKDLMDFHARYKLLLMGYGQEAMRRMGRAAASKAPLEERFLSYSQELSSALTRPPRCRSWTNVMMHAMGHFSDRLVPAEREDFLRTLELYGEGKVPITAPMALLRSWALRYEDSYVREQAFFEPYPQEFMGYMGAGACSEKDVWDRG